MGTLGNQPEREPFRVDSKLLEGFLSTAVTLAQRYGISVDAVVAAKHALELERQNSIAIQDGDFRDEHAAGIGECLREIADALRSGR